jgi:hypothetical protein
MIADRGIAFGKEKAEELAGKSLTYKEKTSH